MISANMITASNANNANEYVSSSNILTLDIDCLEELFEWLSLRDLRALRETCKRMKRAVDYYIQMTYCNGFGKLKILNETIRELRAFEMKFCKLYKHIELDYCPLFDYKTDNFINILYHIEKLTIRSVSMECDAYEYLFQNSQNLMHLLLSNNKDFATSQIGYEWMLHKHPALQHLSLFDQHSDDDYAAEIIQLQTFFHLNPNVHRFSTESHILHANKNWMLQSNIKLQQLDIQINLTSQGTAFDCSLLNALHEHGFYEKLHLYVNCTLEPRSMNEIASVKALEKLSQTYAPPGLFIWPSMAQLKEFTGELNPLLIDDHINSFVNIERIYLKTRDFNNILPFIRRSSKLKEIKIWMCSTGGYIHDGVIDLHALNEERQKCRNATKITIYIRENIYLKTKRTISMTNLSRIELRRAETRVWDLELYDD